MLQYIRIYIYPEHTLYLFNLLPGRVIPFVTLVEHPTLDRFKHIQRLKC